VQRWLPDVFKSSDRDILIFDDAITLCFARSAFGLRCILVSL
jgi:hypothetical protein